MNKSRILISFLLIIISLLWAGSFVVVDIIVDQITPINLGFLRFLLSIPFMILSLFLFKKDKYIPIRELPNLMILGLTGVTLLYIFQFSGIELTTPATSAVLVNTNVIFILILSYVFLKEKLSIKKTTGILVTFIGVIVIMFAQLINENIVFDSTFFTGCILIILSAFCWAIFSVVGKKLLNKYDSITVITYSFIIGAIFYFPLIYRDFAAAIQNIDFNGWMALLYLSLLCTVFSYIGWYYALGKIEASKASVFLTLIPPFAIAFSIIFGEKPTLFFIGGTILIICGVYYTQKS
jgi:drug/metabolite transporter (DMT)-like permease